MVEAGEAAINPLKHTASVLKFLKTQTDAVVLFYSGGKDSVILLDLLSKSGFQVNIAFMYFVEGLEHTERYLEFARKKYGATVRTYQHWMVSHYAADNYYRLHTEKHIPLIKLLDVEEKAKVDAGCQWVVNGIKKADSMNRRLQLGTLFMHAIELNTKKAYPLSEWKKSDCFAYIKQHRLPLPITYGMTKNSSGVDLNYNVLSWLSVHYPQDLQKILKVFPLAETILHEQDQ